MEEDWRNIYFVPENLHAGAARAEASRPLIPLDMITPLLATRFILSNPALHTPGAADREWVPARERPQTSK